MAYLRESFKNLWNQIQCLSNENSTSQRTALYRSKYARELLNLRYIKSPTKILNIGKRGNTFDWKWESVEQERLQSFASGLISRKNPSLYQAGKAYGLSDKLIMELAELFQWDISFALDLRNGDTFSVIYEKIYVEGVEVGAGKYLQQAFQT